MAKVEKHHHHILPTKTALVVFVALLILTIVTVAVAKVDLGRLNSFIAVLVATIKALLVALIFMNLRNDRRENGIIFATAFLFLAIFMVLTATDLFFRGDVYWKDKQPFPAIATKSTLKQPWISTPELVTKGKALYDVQCVACHGAGGKGDGPAAGALNPKPRDFTSVAGWKNWRKASGIFKTLKEGLSGSAMASFATLPSDDRWALSHYVVSLGSNPGADTPADLAKIGIDPTKDGGGAAKERTIPIDLAIEIMSEK